MVILIKKKEINEINDEYKYYIWKIKIKHKFGSRKNYVLKLNL